MSKLAYMFILLIAMAGITYLIRMLPLAIFRKKIKSTYLKSVLYYLPFAVLSAMTFPYILYSTGNFYAALVAAAVALISAAFKLSLILVAILSCAAALIIILLI